MRARVCVPGGGGRAGKRWEGGRLIADSVSSCISTVPPFLTLSSSSSSSVTLPRSLRHKPGLNNHSSRGEISCADSNPIKNSRAPYRSVGGACRMPRLSFSVPCDCGGGLPLAFSLLFRYRYSETRSPTLNMKDVGSPPAG